MSPNPTTTPTATLCLVVGHDFTDSGGAAFDEAARIGKRVKGSALHLVHVFDEAPEKAAATDLVARLRVYVNEKAAALGGFAGMTVGIHVRTGKVARELAQLASEVHADLLVLGARPGPSRSWLVGVTAHKLMGNAPCPVLVAGSKPAHAEPHVPAIEPPCPDCLTTRASTKGAEWWCARHAGHHIRPHTFSYQRELSFESHDSEVIPTGI